MKQPQTLDEIKAFQALRRANPAKALRTASEWIEDDPHNAKAFFDRHDIWMELGRPRKALDDIGKSIELEPHPMSYLARGDVYRHIGQYREAIEDYGRGEAMDPLAWQADAVPLLFQADTYARLGDEANALSYCSRLPEHFWTPGFRGAPRGNKTEIAEELKRRAASARRRQT